MEIEKKLERIISDVGNISNNIEKFIKRSNDADKNVLIACKEAARILGVAPGTISVMIKQGRLHKVTIGESTGIRLSEIRNYTNPQ